MGKKQIFGIRKLKTSVASVIIGAVLFGGNVVQGEELVNTESTKDATTSNEASVTDPSILLPDRTSVLLTEVDRESSEETATELNATSDLTTSLVEEDEEVSAQETTELNATSDSTTSLVEDEETSVPETTELNATSDSTTSLVEDDEEANRVETSNTITTPPVNEVIERGSKVTVLDNESPKLIDVTINQSLYHPGDEVRGSIIFEEESDLSYVSFSFTNETDKGPTELGNGQSDVGNIKLEINSEGQYVYNYHTFVPDNVYSTTYDLI
ncbi:YSIRK-type signal peptide-containing protein [Streptococcus macedonicus]|uniref:YSIRK-type signal peptide-containing protein n=1 Tax=Streptococcus macedonicus TaxID=59310 RepID=UPI0015D4EBF2|nr:YSIRK-type signal peptide-containing protein [Streptococcus macedonicus]